MNLSDLEGRPTKKRRFFVEDSPILDATLRPEPAIPDEINALPESFTGTEEDLNSSVREGGGHTYGLSLGEQRDGRSGEFDIELFASVIGERLSSATIKQLAHASENDVQRAVNLYLDGSWTNEAEPAAPKPSITHESSASDNNTREVRDVTGGETRSLPVLTSSGSAELTLKSMPSKRYIGAFGVVGWATRSGSGLIAHGDRIGIERAKPSGLSVKTGKGGKPRPGLNKRQDIIVRFTNARGAEVGRLENESAAWISTLLDQKVCSFEGSCVFVPDRIRTNDSVYLQLRCYFLKEAFDGATFMKPLDNNRQTGLFEAKETQDERDLRLRQIALVKLFNEINLQPTKVNAAAEKHRRQGLLKAAEVSEQLEREHGSNVDKTHDPGSASPPSDDAEEGQELEQDQLDTLYKKAQSFDFNTPEAEPAETFVMNLRKYQKQALFWMMGKEKDEKLEHKEASMHPLWEEYAWPAKDVDGNNLPEVAGSDQFYVNPYSGELSLSFPAQEQKCLGGILADEMGLGKTIEMLSLIHSHTDEALQRASINGPTTITDLPRLPRASSSVERAPCTTLVVAPMSLLAQWQSEAEKASQAGSLKVLVYYGSDRAVNLQALCCESNAASAPNIIITSYGNVLSEYNQVVANGGNRGTHGGLFSLDYFRIILDEAHYIKNRQSKTAKACYELSARHRWVLTGTPIVNRLEDLFSLVRFLRVEPWSNFSFWKTFITVPFESKDFLRALDVVQTVLEPLVLRRTKDMKTPDGQALVPLPPRTIQVEQVELSKAEREVYDYIYTRAKRTFNANVEAGTLMKSYTTIFAQILRLRQSCCHPVLTRNKSIVAEEDDAAGAADIANGLADDMDLQALIERFTSDEGEQDANKYGAHVLKQIQAEADDECPICAEEPMNEQAVAGCWHSACKQCLLDYIEHQRDRGEIPRCFNCREPINSRDVFQVIRHDEDEEDAASLYADRQTNSSPHRISLRRVGCDASAKISSLISHLKRLRREDPSLKSVIFSQFTSFLDLIEPALERDRIQYLRFDGSMAQKQRAAVLAEFQSRSKGIVLLLSLRAGGVGLNLTCARRVFMMDPWWSFAVEAQAIDRVHRMGQESEVFVHRFIVAGSIEEKMLKIQDRKKFIASSLGMMSDEEKRLQRIEDIKELLS